MKALVLAAAILLVASEQSPARQDRYLRHPMATGDVAWHIVKLIKAAKWLDLRKLVAPEATLVISEQNYDRSTEHKLSYDVDSYELYALLGTSKSGALLRRLRQAIVMSDDITHTPRYEEYAFRELPVAGYGLYGKEASNAYWKIIVGKGGKVIGIYLGYH